MDQESIQKIEIDDNLEDIKNDQELLEQLENFQKAEKEKITDNEKNTEEKNKKEFDRNSYKINDNYCDIDNNKKNENSIILLRKMYDDVNILNDEKKKI